MLFRSGPDTGTSSRVLDKESSEAIFEYKTESRRINLAYTARNRSTDSIRVLFMYDFPGPGHLYKAREGAVDRIFRTLDILAPDPI